VTVLGEWNVIPPPFAPTQPTFERQASPFTTPVDASRIMTTTNPTKEKIVFIEKGVRWRRAFSFGGVHTQTVRIPGPQPRNAHRGGSY
jgi:hypothetical protein